jgi:hypothetical protein
MHPALPCYGLVCWLESFAVNQGCSLCINCLKSVKAFWVPTLLAKLFRTNPPEWCFTWSSILAKTGLSKSCKAIACQTARSFIAKSALRRFCLSRQAIGLIGFNSGSLNCYSFRSCLIRLGVGLSQFRPVVLPVKGAQVFAGDGTACSALDGCASLPGDSFFAANPIGHDGRGNAQSLRDGQRSPALLIHPVFEVHRSELLA